MKKILTLNSFFLAALLILTGCPDPDPVPIKKCEETVNNYFRDVNGFDNRIGSPYQNKVFAVFKFNQDISSYTDNCKPIKGIVKLKLQNMTDKKITFDYRIVFSLNANTWEAQGAATIDPNALYDAGEIVQRASRVDQVSIQIITNSLVYQ